MPKPTGKEIADALLAARALMNDKGAHWIKGQMRKTKRRKIDGEEIKEVSFCSIGAIREVTQGNPALRRAAIAKLAESIPRSTPGYSNLGYGSQNRVIRWNDDWEHRKWGDISRAFRAAARRALKS